MMNDKETRENAAEKFSKQPENECQSPYEDCGKIAPAFLAGAEFEAKRLEAMAKHDAGTIETLTEVICHKNDEIKDLREGLRKCILWAEMIWMRLPYEERSNINATYLNLARDVLAKSPPNDERGAE